MPSSTVTSTLKEVTLSLRSPSEAILRTRPGKMRSGIGLGANAGVHADPHLGDLVLVDVPSRCICEVSAMVISTVPPVTEATEATAAPGLSSRRSTTPSIGAVIVA